VVSGLRLGAFGLRGRIVGVVLVTAVATLAVAAVALLGPLSSSLRNAARTTLISELRGATAQFKVVDLYDLAAVAGPSEKLGRDARDDLKNAQVQLGQRIGGIAALLGYPGTSGHGQVLLKLAAESPLNYDSFNDVTRAFRTNRAQYAFGSIAGTEYVLAALPFTKEGARYALAVRRPINDLPLAASAVRTAFLVAALVALGLTLLLGIPLSARIVRRLRALRQAALRLAQNEPVEIPADRARDEVGDLARAFALMQRQLHNQEEARRAFVATASHELRTPLASIDAMLELLEEDLTYEDPDLQDAQSLLARARLQSRRLGRLAADLLDLSRLDAQLGLRSEPVELSELSRAVMAEFELGTAERGIVTVLDDDNGSVWALGDPGSVARILRILLDNAVRLSPPQGHIHISLKGDGHASLSVSDEGPGVDPEERDRIFERFMRGRQTAGNAGFGLGLAIGRELAQRMGGELTLEGRDGPGARFTLSLPIAHAAEEPTVTVA
jgi:signal transduction histidine kinase